MALYEQLSVSCIIPMYNEEQNVGQILAMAEKMFIGLGCDWEIIVVESGSTDNTWNEIQTAIKGKDRIKAFHQDRREGLGAALRMGYAKSSKDVLCHLEADAPFEMLYFRKALPTLLENECVIGYRVGGKEHGFRWSYSNKGIINALMRGAFHRVYNILLRLIFGLNVRDANFSFKIFRKEHIKDLKLISNGWFIDAEILLELKKKGILPIEIPIVYIDRTAGESSVKLSGAFYMFYEMMRYARKN